VGSEVGVEGEARGRRGLGGRGVRRGGLERKRRHIIIGVGTQRLRKKLPPFYCHLMLY